MSEADGWDPLDIILEHHTPGGGDDYWTTARASAATYGAGTDVVEHLAFLRVVGTPERLERERERIVEALNAVNEAIRDGEKDRRGGYLRPGFYSEEYGEYVNVPDESGVDLVEHLQELVHYLDAAYLEARRVVEALEYDGFQYRDGKLYVTGTGGNDRQIVREVVGRTWEWVREPGDPMYSQEIFSRIRAALASVFPPEVLPDDAGMKSAIQYHQKR